MKSGGINNGGMNAVVKKSLVVGRQLKIVNTYSASYLAPRTSYFALDAESNVSAGRKAPSEPRPYMNYV